MKRLLIISLILLASAVSLCGQTVEGVKFSRIDISPAGDRLNVSFTAEAGNKTVSSAQTLVLSPVLTDGTRRVSLPAIMVQGRRAHIISTRKGSANSHSSAAGESFTVKNGGRLDYSTFVELQNWMNDAILTIETMTMGCCSYILGDEALLTPAPVIKYAANTPAKPDTNLKILPENNIPASDSPVTISMNYGDTALSPAIPSTSSSIPSAPVTTADKIAETMPYVVSASTFSEDMEKVFSGGLLEKERRSSLTVHFKQGSSRIDYNLFDNSQSLIDLMASIRVIETSQDSEVKAIFIAGYASPEGSFAVNDRLAFNRANAVKEYILRNSKIPSQSIRIYNGAEDWKGLRILVENSNMPDRDYVLNIIDRYSVDERETERCKAELKKLDYGRTYLYMLENFFPRLRHAAYIKVYYDNK